MHASILLLTLLSLLNPTLSQPAQITIPPWSTGSALLPWRTHRLLYFGGAQVLVDPSTRAYSTPARASADVWMYDTAMNMWTVLAAGSSPGAPPPFRWCAAAVDGDTMYAVVDEGEADRRGAGNGTVVSGVNMKMEWCPTDSSVMYDISYPTAEEAGRAVRLLGQSVLAGRVIYVWVPTAEEREAVGG
ncbi:hypothetical protein BDK51DRAFT_50654, partial [Blyttiomyces helicus]